MVSQREEVCEHLDAINVHLEEVFCLLDGHPLWNNVSDISERLQSLYDNTRLANEIYKLKLT